MSAPSVSTFYNRKNNAVSTLLSSIDASQLTGTLASGGGAKFPSSGTWFVTIWDNTTYPNNPSGDPNMEVCLVSSRSSDVLTWTRAQSGTTGVTHAAGSTVGLLVMDEALDQHETAITDLEGVVYRSGWIPMGVTLTYSSLDNPTGVVTSSADISTILSVGMKIRFVNGGNTIYGIVTAISGTTITFLHEIAPTSASAGGGTAALTAMANSAITAPFFSYQRAPYGFPMDERKWTFETSSTSDLASSGSSTNTWYNPSGYAISIPIGSWFTSYYLAAKSTRSSTTAQDIMVSLSTATGSESDVDFSSYSSTLAGGNGANTLTLISQMHKAKAIVLAAKTAYYLIIKAPTYATDGLTFVGTLSKTVTRAKCTYI